METKTSPVEIRVVTPIPSSVMLTLGALIDAAWPGSELVHNHDRFPDAIIFRVDNSGRRQVSDQEAADLRVEPAEDDVDVLSLGPEGARLSTPRDISANLIPVIKAAFEANPDAENYLEMTLTDREDGHRYVLTFCRSPQQTPHELRMKAERSLATARSDVHRDNVEAVQRLLNASRGAFEDSYRAGVEAALDALRQSHFGAVDIPASEDD